MAGGRHAGCVKSSKGTSDSSCIRPMSLMSLGEEGIAVDGLTKGVFRY